MHLNNLRLSALDTSFSDRSVYEIEATKVMYTGTLSVSVSINRADNRRVSRYAIGRT